MTEVTLLMPNMPLIINKIPRLETVVVPPMNQLGSSLPYLARLARSLVFLAISSSPRVYALNTIGVISPPSVATATLTSECLNFFITVPAHWALASGTSLKARATALTMISLTLILTPSSFLLSCCLSSRTLPIYTETWTQQ